MVEQKRVTVSEFKERLGLTTKMIDKQLKTRFANAKLRKFGLSDHTSSTGSVLARPKRKTPGGFIGVAVLVVIILFILGQIVSLGTRYPFAAVPLLGLVIVVIVLTLVMKEKLFFNRYKIGLMKYLGNYGGDFPHCFVASIPDETKAGFSFIYFRDLRKSLHVNDVIATCKETKTGDYDAIIYLSHGDASGLQSCVNDYYNPDLLPSLKSSDLEMISEFSELADLYHLNAELVARGNQVNAKSSGPLYISTDLDSQNANRSAQETSDQGQGEEPAGYDQPSQSGETKSKHSSFEDFERKVNEQARKGGDKKGSTPTSEPDPYEQLSAIIGLTTVKLEIVRLKKNLMADDKRRQAGVAVTRPTLHFVFTGNPGTGKTTVARILGRVLKEVGILRNGGFVEATRSSLVAGYIGQTAPLVDKAIDKALGGILFIDEAYALTSGGGGENDFGQEAITQLLKRMEDDRENLVVIVAGYAKEMETFLKSNSGLESRFTYKIHFPDYTPEELGEIFQKCTQDAGYNLGPGVKEAAVAKFEKVLSGWNQATMGPFSNGRYVRNFFDECIREQGNRIVDQDLNGIEVTMILLSDLR